MLLLAAPYLIVGKCLKSLTTVCVNILSLSHTFTYSFSITLSHSYFLSFSLSFYLSLSHTFSFLQNLFLSDSRLREKNIFLSKIWHRWFILFLQKIRTKTKLQNLRLSNKHLKIFLINCNWRTHYYNHYNQVRVKSSFRLFDNRFVPRYGQ